MGNAAITADMANLAPMATTAFAAANDETTKLHSLDDASAASGPLKRSRSGEPAIKKRLKFGDGGDSEGAGQTAVSAAQCHDVHTVGARIGDAIVVCWDTLELYVKPSNICSLQPTHCHPTPPTATHTHSVQLA